MTTPGWARAEAAADGCGPSADGAIVCVAAPPVPAVELMLIRATAEDPHGVIGADVATSDDEADDGSTTTVVASEGPQPGAGAGGLSPEIGPIIVPADGSSFSGAWWLVAFGGLQLVGLFFITRRARARLSTEDARP